MIPSRYTHEEETIFQKEIEGTSGEQECMPVDQKKKNKQKNIIA